MNIFSMGASGMAKYLWKEGMIHIELRKIRLGCRKYLVPVSYVARESTFKFSRL